MIQQIEARSWRGWAGDIVQACSQKRREPFGRLEVPCGKKSSTAK